MVIKSRKAYSLSHFIQDFHTKKFHFSIIEAFKKREIKFFFEFSGDYSMKLKRCR